MRDHGNGLVQGLLRARLSSEPMIQMGPGPPLDSSLSELSGIGRIGRRGGVVSSYDSILGLEPTRTWEYWGTPVAGWVAYEV